MHFPFPAATTQRRGISPRRCPHHRSLYAPPMAALFLCTGDPVLKAEPLGSRLRRVEQLLRLSRSLSRTAVSNKSLSSSMTSRPVSASGTSPSSGGILFSASHSGRTAARADPFDLPGRLFLCKPPGFPNGADGFSCSAVSLSAPPSIRSVTASFCHHTLKLFAFSRVILYFLQFILAFFRLITTMPQRTGT